MKKLLCVFLVVLMFSSIMAIPAAAESHDTLSYILDNIDKLSDLYACVYPESDENFEGTSVELMLPVKVVSTDSTGTYIDFDGDNGYMILVDGNDVIKWEVSGDLDFTAFSGTWSFTTVEIG